MKRILVIALTLGLVGLAACAVGGKARTFIKFGTGTQVGVYYTAGLAWADLINDQSYIHGIDAAVEATDGSVFNLNALASKEIDFAFAQADSQYQAVNGEGPWEGRPLQNLRFVCSLHSEAVTLVADAAGGIASIQDLRGKVVSIGSPSSGTRGNAEDCLELFGLKAGTDYQAEGFSAGEAAMMLQDGRIDAFFYTVGHPNGSLTEATNGKRQVRFIPINGVRQLIERAPYYQTVTIPMKYYPQAANSQDVKTIGMKTVVLTRADVPDEVVYQVTKALIDHLAWFRKRHPSFADLRHREMVTGGFASFHPGAKRYFEEQGISSE